MFSRKLLRWTTLIKIYELKKGQISVMINGNFANPLLGFETKETNIINNKYWN